MAQEKPTKVVNSLDSVDPVLVQFFKTIKEAFPKAYIFETIRTPERQEYLYSMGRTIPGDIVTDARAGSSPHQYGQAIDIWGINFNSAENKINEILKNYPSIRWGRYFKNLKDNPHFEKRDWEKVREQNQKKNLK